MTWLRHLLDAEGEGDPEEFLEALKVDLFEDEVFVFTPKGEIKNLSAGSTPLDFAYAVHTDVGHRCVGARSTARSCRCTTRCAAATSSRSSPPSGSGDRRATGSGWSGRAAPATRSAPFLKTERREDAERKGREELQESLRKRGLPPQRLAGSPCSST